VRIKVIEHDAAIVSPIDKYASAALLRMGEVLALCRVPPVALHHERRVALARLSAEAE
jgi:hypothetical protein